MTEISPLFLDALTYAAKYDRWLAKLMLAEGIFTSGALAVTQNAAPGMSVFVAAGNALVQNDSAEAGSYLIYNDATVTKAIAAADPANPRIDRVIAQIYDATDISGALNKWAIEVLTGVAAGSPAAPALPSNAMSLATVAVAAGATQIVNANITDTRAAISFQTGIYTFGAFPVTPSSAPTTNYQAANKKYVDDAKTTLKANEIIIMAGGFIINGSSATLVDTAGTAAKAYCQHISALKTHWFDAPKFLVPADYDGGPIDITVAWRSAATGKKHSLGIRVASVATTEPHNPDLAAAYQLYNEHASGDTIGDVEIHTVTVTQANHLMVAGEIWHCKFVVEDDAGADADATLFDWIRIKWNKT
jgi:hypothetical protein